MVIHLLGKKPDKAPTSRSILSRRASVNAVICEKTFQTRATPLGQNQNALTKPDSRDEMRKKKEVFTRVQAKENLLRGS